MPRYSGGPQLRVGSPGTLGRCSAARLVDRTALYPEASDARLILRSRIAYAENAGR